MFAVTGATGALGRLTIAALLDLVPAAQIVAVVRDVEKARDLSDIGVIVRSADYNVPASLETAFAGVSRLLLISGNDIGKRVAQHTAVVDAAKQAGVGFIAYTSILHADVSTIGLAEEHRQSEAAIINSGLNYALLRNAWYSENYTGALQPSIAHGGILGSSGEGRISSASRADLATAAAIVLAGGTEHDGKVYELVGDGSFDMTEFAAEVSKQAGTPVPYIDLPEADYAKALEGAGLPDFVAAMIAQSSAASRDGALYGSEKDLSGLIGRPTTPISATIRAALG
jgi:NAD(P)H dehydrogenase (quinone)